VVGNVAKQEVYPLKPNERVLDLLIEAGGAGSGATKAVLVRHDANGKLLQQQLDLKKVMVGDESQNALLQPGDLLYVPDKRHTGPGFLNTGTLTSLLYIFTIF
jgi:protein involved in polysaccharide export with SLBB domain